MVKKAKRKTKQKNKKANNQTKERINKKEKNIFKNYFSIKGLQLTDIQIKIINQVQKNKSSLNFYYDEEKMIKSNQKIIEKVKGSCLCRISDEFGTAVCISEKGYILTCSHAVSPFEGQKTKECLYIFPNGEIVKTLTLEKDEKLDLALLKIIEIYENENKNFIKIEKNPEKKFVYAKIKPTIKEENEKIGENVFCIGNPCFEMFDDEDEKLRRNNYKPFWISFGKIKGYMRDKIYGKNDLGPLIHDCWTYWGHSGAPIFNNNGEVVGMHNSWNEKNANRHGISLLGIINFISKFPFFK